MKWFWFSVVLGFLPVLVALILNLLTDADSHPLRQGDLYLLAGALCFFGVGEIVHSGRHMTGGNAVGFLMKCSPALIVGIVNLVAYTAVSSTRHPHNFWVNVSSILLYVLAVMCSLLCVVEAAGGSTPLTPSVEV